MEFVPLARNVVARTVHVRQLNHCISIGTSKCYQNPVFWEIVGWWRKRFS